MSSPVIVYLPGIFGSELGVGPPNFLFPVTIWVSPLSVISGVVIQLQLAPDGVSPGPRTDGYPVVPNKLIEEYYEPLAIYLGRLGYTVRRSAYDWRHSVPLAAASVYQDISLNLRNQPIVFVAHSMGGLVARAVYQLLRAAGQADQVLRIITLGTPHYGSLVPVQAWFGVAQFYRRLAQVIGWLFPGGPGVRNGMLDVICASWPAMYELMSFRNSGPLFRTNPAAASLIYDSDNYGAGNPFISAGSMRSAITVQDGLNGAIDPGILSCIVGTGVDTAYDLLAGLPLNSPNVYLYTENGDGIVPADSATVSGAQVLTVRGVPHELLPQAPQCWAAVRYCLNQALGPT